MERPAGDHFGRWAEPSWPKRAKFPSTRHGCLPSRKAATYDNTHPLAWTIADLGGREVPGRDELAIALAMRHGDQPGAVRREAVGP